MTNPWPSERPGAPRAKGSRGGSRVPTDWLSGWLVVLAIAGMAVAVIAFVWPIAAQAFDAVQELHRVLDRAAK